MASYKMFQRRLKALEFPIWNKFDIGNMEDIKTLVVYLEQTKIRELKVSERADLKNTKSKNWTRYFGNYLSQIEDCPHQMKQNMDQKDWIVIIDWYSHSLSLSIHFYAHCHNDGLFVLSLCPSPFPSTPHHQPRSVNIHRVS